VSHHDLIVIGASAGGLPALSAIVQRLPANITASVVVVVHTPAENNGFLPSILSRISALPVGFARDQEPLRHGRIYVARPDFHLLVTRRSLRVLHGPRENGFRPRSTRSFGPRHGPTVRASSASCSPARWTTGRTV
jgi:two-component system chemotaxis response regulator CheB